VAALVLVVAAAYAVGVRRLAARGRRWPVARSAAMAGGATAALGSAIVGDASLTRHMGEHLLLGMVAPFLIALSAPMTLALQSGGPATRRGLRRVLHGPIGRVLARPVVGFCLLGGGLVAVYLTPLLERAAASTPTHLAAHAHLVGSGLLFLVPLVGVDALPRPVPFGARLLAVLLAVPFHAFLGVALLAADEPLAPDAYPSLDDQRQAAGVLWAGGELLTLAVAAVVFARWWQAEQRAGRRLMAQGAAPPRPESAPNGVPPSCQRRSDSQG
jgi:cytochrome c oxidase assembly factor CtaG